MYITFVGDFCLADRRGGEETSQTAPRPWASLRSLIGKDTHIVANIECPFTNESKGLPFKWANLRASLDKHALLDGLSAAIIGNNHICDFGQKGAKDTVELLKSKGIGVAGYAENISDAMHPVVIREAGCAVGIVSLCCPTTNGENLATHTTPGVAPLGMASVAAAISGARSQCDLLVVYLHWGPEWVHDPVPDQLRLARHAIDMGADAVIGCHSHTIQSFEQYRNRWIFYGLGNFMFRGGNAQSVDADGQVTELPLQLEAANRESLVVTLGLIKDEFGKRLEVCEILPVRFDDELNLHAVDRKDLTFDIDEANARLKSYTETRRDELRDKAEIRLISRLRNGSLAYWYECESICSEPVMRVSPSLSGIARRLLRRLSRELQSYRAKLLNCVISLKWRSDCNALPLSPLHKELYFIIHRHTFEKLRRFPRLVRPRDFNDKIQWLKLFDQTPDHIRCSDKVLVRDYIRDRVGEQYLTKLYQVADRFVDLDFDALPDAFVIKATHDSGTVILVRDKAAFNRADAAAVIEAALSRKYGWENGEWAYSYVHPRVLIEEHLDPLSSVPPADYKFYCVGGVVRFCHYISDRGSNTSEQTLDRDGNDLKTPLYPSFRLGDNFIRPAVWSEMVSVAEAIAHNFRCVRVDLFCVGGRIFAGEITFWPMAGCYEGQGQEKLGRYLDFDRTQFMPCLLPHLGKQFDASPAEKMRPYLGRREVSKRPFNQLGRS